MANPGSVLPTPLLRGRDQALEIKSLFSLTVGNGVLGKKSSLNVYSCLSCLKNDNATGELREIPLFSSVSFVTRLYEMLDSKNCWES